MAVASAHHYVHRWAIGLHQALQATRHSNNGVDIDDTDAAGAMFAKPSGGRRTTVQLTNAPFPSTLFASRAPAQTPHSSPGSGWLVRKSDTAEHENAGHPDQASHRPRILTVQATPAPPRLCVKPNAALR